MLVAGSLRSFPQEGWSWPAFPREESGTFCSLPILGHVSRSAIDSPKKNLSSKNIEDRTFYVPCSMFHGRGKRRREKIQPNRETVRNPTRTKLNSNKTFCYCGTIQGSCVCVFSSRPSFWFPLELTHTTLHLSSSSLRPPALRHT